MQFKAFKNGAAVSDAKSLTAFQSEAVGVFESLRTYNGIIFRLDDHLERLEASAKTAGIELPARKKIKKEIEAAAAAFGEKEVFLRVTFWNNEFWVMAGERRHSEAIYRKGVQLKTSSFIYPDPHSWANQSKTTAYQLAVLTSTLPNPSGTYDWLMITRDGFLTESRIGNFFTIKNPPKPELWTPPERLVLNGVTRRVVIECAFKLGMKVFEEPLTRHDFFNADEAFLSNTSWEILPVVALDGRAIGSGKPGPLAKKLRREFKREVHRICRRKKSVTRF